MDIVSIAMYIGLTLVTVVVILAVSIFYYMNIVVGGR
jgi:hypothetical protein